MTYATLDDLRSQLGGTPQPSAAYAAKMLHPLPETTAVDRMAFILKHCVGKRVVEFGASGMLHDRIVEVAAELLAVDRTDGPGVRGFDLDDVTLHGLPMLEDAEVIVCGELLEHLSNPGWFLTRLHRQYPGVPTLISVPNAFAAVQQKWLAKGLENVNLDHCAWYSPKTLGVLLERAGFVAWRFFWYGGDGPTAEGLIVACE